jgi:hypothetical protein
MHVGNRAWRSQPLSDMQRDETSIHPDVKAAVDSFVETMTSIVMRREQDDSMTGASEVYSRIHYQAFGPSDAEVGMDERDAEWRLHCYHRNPNIGAAVAFQPSPHLVGGNRRTLSRSLSRTGVAGKSLNNS